MFFIRTTVTKEYGRIKAEGTSPVRASSFIKNPRAVFSLPQGKAKKPDQRPVTGCFFFLPENDISFFKG